MRQVRLDCSHYIGSTGDKVQPLRVGAARWCGECKAWRKVAVLLPKEAS